MAAIVGLGQIAIWEGGSLWLFRAGEHQAETAVHRHHSIQIAFCLHGEFTFVAGEEVAHGPVTAIRPDAPHMFRAHGAVAHLFVEPESPPGRALAAQLFGDTALAPLDSAQAREALAALRTCFEAGASLADLKDLGARIVGALAAVAGSPPADPRVLAMIDYAASHLDGPPTLPAAASAACLSPSRARHLFVEKTGIAFSAYVLWLRLERAVEHYAAGQSLTAAAHDAGFADSAHLSRTFRRTFGLPAAALRIELG